MSDDYSIGREMARLWLRMHGAAEDFCKALGKYDAARIRLTEDPQEMAKIAGFGDVLTTQLGDFIEAARDHIEGKWPADAEPNSSPDASGDQGMPDSGKD